MPVLDWQGGKPAQLPLTPFLFGAKSRLKEQVAQSSRFREDSLTPTPTRRDEAVVFVILAVVLAPVLAVAIVGSYGFAIWMYQLLSGPPMR